MSEEPEEESRTHINFNWTVGPGCGWWVLALIVGAFAKDIVEMILAARK